MIIYHHEFSSQIFVLIPNFLLNVLRSIVLWAFPPLLFPMFFPIRMVGDLSYVV